MAKPTQQELMTAHNIARNSAEKASAAAEAEGKSVPQIVGNKNIEPFEPEHPFGGNDNNRRIAERIVKEGAKLKQVSTSVPLTGAEAALADLKRAEALDALDEPQMTDKQLAERDDAATAAALAAAKSQPVSDAPTEPIAPAAAPAWTPRA